MNDRITNGQFLGIVIVAFLTSLLESFWEMPDELTKVNWDMLHQHIGINLICTSVACVATAWVIKKRD